ncbi:MAG: DUF5671 domain-containing protein [bacterium]|nr:DUF5671 domain-containing protein [bacterium]
MDKPKVTPKDFFLWAGAMIALYISIFSLISLLFDYINYTFPDVLNYYVDPYSSSIRYEMAALIVLFPLFLLLMRFIRKDIARVPQKRDLWIRRWVLYLTVFVAGAAVAGALITLINYFLGGEITTRFILKVFVVVLVAGAGLLHFLADIWGYWVQYPERARMIGWGAGVVVLASIAAGFFIMGSPNQIRLYRFDDQKVNDLANVQSQIVNYWRSKEKLPATLDGLQDSIRGNLIPLDPQTKTPYVYQVTGKYSFKLCATFNAETQQNSPTVTRAMIVEPMPAAPIGVTSDVKGGGLEQSTWQHGAGEICFDRTIDPQLYPPVPKQKPL